MTKYLFACLDLHCSFENFVLLANHFEANWKLFFKIKAQMYFYYIQLLRRTHYSFTVTWLKSDTFNWQISRIIDCLLEQLNYQVYTFNGIDHWNKEKSKDFSVIIVPINPFSKRNCIRKNMAKSLRSPQIIFHFFSAFVSIHKATMYF